MQRCMAKSELQVLSQAIEQPVHWSAGGYASIRWFWALQIHLHWTGRRGEPYRFRGAHRRDAAALPVAHRGGSTRRVPHGGHG